MAPRKKTTLTGFIPHKIGLLIFLGAAWGLLVTLLAAFLDPTPENWTLAASIWTAGLYTVGLGLARRWWLPLLQKTPIRNAALLSIANAAVIETEFLLFQTWFGAEGVAAHPNLLLDLILTMPWYILMAVTFVRVQHRWRFSIPTVLLLGGVYELGADGIIGALFGGAFGQTQLFTLNYWGSMILFSFWAFLPVYSSLVLPPAWLIATTEAAPTPDIPGWQAALKPLLWLGPFGVYLLLIMLLSGVISEIGTF